MIRKNGRVCEVELGQKDGGLELGDKLLHMLRLDGFEQ